MPQEGAWPSRDEAERAHRRPKRRGSALPADDARDLQAAGEEHSSGRLAERTFLRLIAS